jgi:hypothetical protein
MDEDYKSWYNWTYIVERLTITAIPRLTKSQNINIILHYKCGSTGGTDLTKWYAAV